MVVVDTSVWIEAFRDREGLPAKLLNRLLDDDLVALTGPSRLELLLGARRRDEPRLRRLLSALPCWFPERDTWRLAESWIQPALRAGQRFGFADLLIGAITREKEASIWSLDRDFDRMASSGWSRSISLIRTLRRARSDLFVGASRLQRVRSDCRRAQPRGGGAVLELRRVKHARDWVLCPYAARPARYHWCRQKENAVPITPPGGDWIWPIGIQEPQLVVILARS